MRLDHVALTVADRERSAAFYATHFGFGSRVHEHGDLLILSSGDGGLLALFEGDPVAAALPRTNHFGFRAAGAGEVRAARRVLRDAGVTETEWQDDGRFVRLQVSDPDGYRVDLYSMVPDRS